jgi:2-keto-3-deoxy-L-rhamnonate aldolase RhmA
MINIEQPENLKTFAHIVDGKVVNVSLWAETPDEELVEIPEGTVAGIDWDYIDGEFVDNRPKIEIGAL